MKSTIAAIVCGIVAFGAMHVFMRGGNVNLQSAGILTPGGLAQQKEPSVAKFPEELEPIVRGQAIEKANAWKWDTERAPMVAVLLKDTGSLHSWHAKLPVEMRSESVEDTEMILVVGSQRRSLVEIIKYKQRGAPPIRRYRYQVNVWLVEAKTGKIIGFKDFESEPRPVNPTEYWDTTVIGTPVEHREVFQWFTAEVQRLRQEALAETASQDAKTSEENSPDNDS